MIISMGCFVMNFVTTAPKVQEMAFIIAAMVFPELTVVMDLMVEIIVVNNCMSMNKISSLKYLSPFYFSI